MESNFFGSTGLSVPVLGLGTSQIGDPAVSEGDAAAVLGCALDSGVTLIDTAHCYGIAEERIGRHVAHRRDEFILSTKCGHQMEGFDDWTPAIVRASVEESLRRLRTECLDILHLHSCDTEALADGSLADELDALAQEGKIRVAAYSGDNDALAAAVASERFGSIQASINIADQHNLRTVIPDADAAGLGIIAKRPIANAIWRHDERPERVYGWQYWDRLQELAYDVNLPMAEFALRFTAFAPGVCTAILGTTNPENLKRSVHAVEQGPLPDTVMAHVGQRWLAVGRGWESRR